MTSCKHHRIFRDVTPFENIKQKQYCCCFCCNNFTILNNYYWLARWRTGSASDQPRMWPFAIIQDVGGRHLGFVRIENSAVRSAVPENPTLEPNMKWIGSPVAEIWPFACVGGIWNPHFGGRVVVGGQRWHH